MKTAIQQAIEIVQKEKEMCYEEYKSAQTEDEKEHISIENIAYSIVLSKLQSLLPAEQEQIQASFNAGISEESGRQSGPHHENQSATDYFTTTYLNE